MPGRDQTGPLGGGPMTGRRMGICGSRRAPDYTFQRFGAGVGRGLGFGQRGGRRQFFGNRFGRCADWPYYQEPYRFAPTVQDEKEQLEREASYLENELVQLKRRLSDLENAAAKEAKNT